MTGENKARRWEELRAEERTRLLEEFGRYQDQLPRTCSMELKVDRLRSWLLLRGIEYH